MPEYSVTTLQPKYHQAIVDWQVKNFPEFELLIRNWDEHFKHIEPFQLVAKIGTLRSDAIEGGTIKGQHKFERAGEMTGNMFYTARDIIKAQCSTELGSIQQHRLSLEYARSDEAQYAMLRIMAEELRHAYQMFWVLEHDPTWKKPGHGDVATETIEALLGMELGTHVLDAFNIPFDNFLDNILYTMCIDLVGKYQLDMQKIFSYAPMARSMGPMFSEEAFHLGSGRKYLKQIAVEATRGEGDYSIPDIQRCLNEWYPRGLEMFGNEQGGETAVAFGFKDKLNGVAQAEYVAEVHNVVWNTNVSILSALKPQLSGEDARELARKISSTHEPQEGVQPEELLFLPAKTFFRARGPEEIVFQPYDVYGRPLTRDGKPISAREYVEYLQVNLPAKYLRGREFEKYRQKLLNRGQATQSPNSGLIPGTGDNL